MAKYSINDTTLTAIADAIRAKTGKADAIIADNFPATIDNIKTPADGSIPTQEAKTITPSASEQTAVASGVYTAGAVIVKGDTNLTAENIAKDVSIFGVVGSHEGGAKLPVVGETCVVNISTSGRSGAINNVVHMNEAGIYTVTYGSSSTYEMSVTTLKRSFISVSLMDDNLYPGTDTDAAVFAKTSSITTILLGESDTITLTN